MQNLGPDFRRLRLREGERVPLGDSVWLLAVVNESGTLRPYEFRTSNDGLKALLSFLSISRPTESLMILGIWHGQYRTDAFLMDPRELKKHVGECLQYREERRKDSMALRKKRRLGE